MPQPLPAQRPPAPPAFDAVAVLDQLALPVVVADAGGQLIYRNLEARKQLDATSLRDFLARNDVRPLIFKAISQRITTELSSSLADAAARWFRVRCSPLAGPAALVVLQFSPLPLDTDGEPPDVSRRLASLGKLASRVAHELNNPLDGILRYINLALRVAGDAPESKLTSYLAESRSGLMRMTRIIGDLLEFSRNTDAGFEEVPVNELIEQAIHACSPAAEANRVIITADFQTGELPRVGGARIYQICSNLIRNAIDAMPDGGRLSITSGVWDQSLIIRIADTGVGLPHPAEKVFEPFYTTKPPGKGTGLGLAICREIVEGLGGTITAENAPGGGAVFTLMIPVAGLQSPHRITPAGKLSRTF